MDKLPFLISIPHGGNQTPKEIQDRVSISRKDLFEDGDAFTREIYDIQNEVTALISSPIARAFVDMNRDLSDLPPDNPDGLVKTQTCHGKSIYAKGKELNQKLTNVLTKNYYDRYHKKIETFLKKQKNLKLGLDCHSMEPMAPQIAPDQGGVRPSICLSNNFGKSCPNEIVEILKSCFQQIFKLSSADILINKPFAGGFITRKFGNNPIPWIQIEMNRNLYLTSPWFNKKTLRISQRRLSYLRNNFKLTLEIFYKTTF